MEVIAMARDGRIHPEVAEFPLDRAVKVYAKLKGGEIRGRAGARIASNEISAFLRRRVI
jgi:D-arabinose 1-dehydrogenase-like Zn-dependent alcohol dehydrogenase